MVLDMGLYEPLPANKTSGQQKDAKYFSTIDAATNYIAWNKPQFTLAEIMANSEWYSGNDKTELRTIQCERLTDIAKKKTK